MLPAQLRLKRSRSRSIRLRYAHRSGTPQRHQPRRYPRSSRPSGISTASATFPVPRGRRFLEARSLGAPTFRSPWLSLLAHWTLTHRPRPRNSAWPSSTMLWATPTISPRSSFLTVRAIQTTFNACPPTPLPGPRSLSRAPLHRDMAPSGRDYLFPKIALGDPC